MGKKTKRPLKVLHAPLNFANQAYVLSEALRARGIDSHLLRYRWEDAATTRVDDPDTRFADISRKDWFGDLLRNVQNIANGRFDIVHFWNRTLVWRRPDDVFNGIDIPFLRLAGSRLAYRLTGYELRRKSLELEVNPFTPYRYGYESPFKEDDQQRYMDYLTSYIDAFIVQDPGMQTHCPRARIIPRAIDFSQLAVAQQNDEPRILVVHKTRDKKLTGSNFVVKAVDTLKEEGIDFDFLLVENRPSDEVLALYRRADIVVDQLSVGWYGGSSVAAMALGKPVIAYIRDDLQTYFRDGMPVVNANPQTITKVLREAIKDRELRREFGDRAIKFAQTVHDGRAVAKAAAKLYKRMLKAPVSRIVPDFGYQLSGSINFAKMLSAGDRERNLQQKFDELQTAHKSQTEELTRLRQKTADYEKFEREVPTLRSKAERYDQVERELSGLRHDAGRYEALKSELPALRYKAKRYDEIKDAALEWRAKADRFDRFAAKRRVRFALRLFGLLPAIRIRRAPKNSTKSTRTAAGGGAHATGDAVGEAGKGDHVCGATGAADARQITAVPGSRLHGKGRICIVSHKRVGSITRAPRMAKSLVDAGYEVVVVSLSLPVAQLQEMCPQVEYIKLAIRPYPVDIRERSEQRRQIRNAVRSGREQQAANRISWHALRLRAGRAVSATVRSLGWLSWHIGVVGPCALLLKSRSEGFSATWRKLATEDAIQIGIRFAMFSYPRALSQALAEEADKATRGYRFDVVQAYDSYALLAAKRLATRDAAKLIHDAVELSSVERNHRNVIERIGERLHRRRQRRVVRQADAVITVSDGLADRYARDYRIARPLVVRNCRHYWPYEADSRIRNDAAVSSEARLLVWCGLIYPKQGLEILLNTLPRLPDVHFAIVGFFQNSQKRYAQAVIPQLIDSLGVSDRVHILPAREPNDLVPYISGADIGVISRSRSHPNNYFSMPNKFLEMVMARLPIAVSQLGDMVDLINKYDMGGVFDERCPTEIAAVIERMIEPTTYTRLKANVMKAAEVLAWEEESQPYLERVELLMPAWARTAAAAARREVPQPDRLSPADSATLTLGDAARDDAGASRGSRRRAKSVNLSEENFHLRAANERLRGAYRQTAEANQKLRRTIHYFRTLTNFYGDNRNINHYLRFARYCHERASDLKADAYVAHGVETLPAADTVAQTTGGRVYCDVIEMPSFAQRSVTYDLLPAGHSLLDHAFDGYLRDAAGLTTVGWQLANEIRDYGPRVTVIPNYRNRTELQRSDMMRERCGLGSEDRLLLATSTISSGLAPIIEALNLLPENVHLATLGNIFRDYRGAVLSAVAQSGVEKRVHFLDPVPYDQLANVASGANVGLIAVDAALKHWQISLPNRLFDCIAAGLPIVTPNVPDIARIVVGRNIGVALTTNDARGWANAISAALADEKALRENALAATNDLVWESLEDQLLAAYDHAASVTIIGFGDLTEHQRTIRMAGTLVKRGVRVTVCCPHEGPVPDDRMPGVRFVLTPSPVPNLAAQAGPAMSAVAAALT